MTSKIAKLIIQILSSILGIIGLILFYFTITTFIEGFEYPGLFVIALVNLVFGSILVAIAYFGLFRFSAESIGYVTCIIGFIAYGKSSDLFRNLTKDVVLESHMAELIRFILPIVIGVLTHKILKWLFVRLIYRDIQPGHGPDGVRRLI